jgi:hypothetical protein
VEFSWKTIQGVNCRGRAIAVFVGLLGSVTLGPSCAYAQSEIDPDHFDSPNTESIPQPRTADSRVAATRYEGAFSLPYQVQCNGKRLAPGKYSVSVRFNGKVWQATLNQKGHAIEIAAVVAAEARKPHNERDEVVVIESDKKVRTLSVVRVSGFDFVFGAKPRRDPLQDNKPAPTEKLPLAVIVP